MGTFQVPGRVSGKTYNLKIKGDTPSDTEQARIRAFIEEKENAFAADYEARYGAPLAVDDGTALGRGFELGKAGAYSRLGTATEYLGSGLGLESLADFGRGMRESGDQETFLETLRQPAPTQLEDVKGLGSFLTYAGEGIGQSGPEMLAPLAAAGIGTLVGGPVAGVGAGAVTAFPSFFGGNIQRQEEEVAAGRKDKVDVTDAVISAVGQSALNAIGDKLLLGGFLKPGQKWLTRTAVGAGEGAAAEIPTEITQQIIERKQAGLPLDDDEAINEYVNAGVLGGIMGGGIRGTTAGLGIGVEKETPPPTLLLPRPALITPPPGTPPSKPTGTASVSGVRRQGPRNGPATTTTVILNDGTDLTLDGDATQADIDRAVSEYNQTKAAAAPPSKPTGAASPNVEDIPDVEIIPDEVYAEDAKAGAGTYTQEDLAAARSVYDEVLANEQAKGANPDEAERIAASSTLDYIDTLPEDTKQRLSRFRATMARFASIPASLPDEAYSYLGVDTQGSFDLNRVKPTVELEDIPVAASGIITDAEAFDQADAEAAAAGTGVAAKLKAQADEETRKQAEIAQSTPQSWLTLKPGDKVTLYRGEGQDNTEGGDWWTTDANKAAQYGAVRSFTADALDVGKVAVQGHGGTDEFYFPEGVPPKFLTAPKAAPKVEAPQAVATAAQGDFLGGLEPAAPTAAPTAAPPNVEIAGPDWIKEGVAFNRKLADRRGITGKIEDLFATGLTAGQVRIRLENDGDLTGIDPTDRPGFVVGVRASLGIPSQQSQEGKAEFDDWLEGYKARKAPQDAAQATTQETATETAPPVVSSKLERQLAPIREYFATGNIVESYSGGNDRVLSFDLLPNGGWEVEVEPVKEENGQWVTTGKPRRHSSFNAKRNRVPVQIADTTQEATNDGEGAAVDGLWQGHLRGVQWLCGPAVGG